MDNKQIIHELLILLKHWSSENSLEYQKDIEKIMESDANLIISVYKKRVKEIVHKKNSICLINDFKKSKIAPLLIEEVIKVYQRWSGLEEKDLHKNGKGEFDLSKIADDFKKFVNTEIDDEDRFFGVPEMQAYLLKWTFDNRKDLHTRFQKTSPDKQPELYEKEIYPVFCDAIIYSLYNMAFADVRKSAMGTAYMGAFILGSCYIDYLSSLNMPSESVTKRYKAFVLRYMPTYNCEALYYDLRCKLVHNYSEGGSYIFLRERPLLHQTFSDSHGKIILNLENFIEDLEKASYHYFSDLRDFEKDITVFKNAVEGFIINPLLRTGKVPPEN